METFVEDTHYQNLALRKAEQKKLNNLKNINLPWVFVEPTRLKSVKIPKPKKTASYYEGIDDEDLEFLGNSKIPFTKDDIKVLRNSLHGETNSISEHEFYDDFDNFEKPHEKHLIIKEDPNLTNVENKDSGRVELNINVDAIIEDKDENIVSSRSNADAIDDLFTFEDDKPKKLQEEEEQMEVEAETVKNIIMAAVKEREEATKLSKRKIESNRPLSFFSFEVDKVTPEGQTVVKERMTRGRRKLLSAISVSSSLKNEEGSIKYAKNKYEKENTLKRAALEKCFGAKHFKDFLEKQNAEIPQVLLNVS